MILMYEARRLYDSYECQRYAGRVGLVVWQNYRKSFKKNTEVKVLPVVDLFEGSAK